MNLYLLVPLIAIVICRNPTIYSNVMTFDRTTSPSQIHKVIKITKPISTLSIVEIQYDCLFAMHVLRKYYSIKKQYFFQVNFTAWSPQPANVIQSFMYKLTFRYMLSRQLNNIQIHNVNLTSSRTVDKFTPRHLQFSKTRCLLFVIGFSHSGLATRSNSVMNPQSLEFCVSINGRIQESEWMFLEVILMEENSILCGQSKAEEVVREVEGQQKPERIQIQHETAQLFYIFGISRFSNESSGRIIYEAQSNSVQVTRSGFIYSIFPIHFTCIYTEKQEKWTALIIILSVLMGTGSVLIVSMVAYLIRKYFDNKKQTKPLILVGQVFHSQNALVEVDENLHSVKRLPSAAPLVTSTNPTQ